MRVEAQVTINGSKEAVWAVITDIEKRFGYYQWHRRTRGSRKAGQRTRGPEVAGDTNHVR